MRWQKDARTKFDHLPPAFCRCSVSGKLSTSSSRFPQGICFPSPLKGKAKALSPARKQKISSLCSEIFGKNPPNAKRSPLRYGSWSPVGTGKTDRRDSGEWCWTRATGTQRPPFLRKVPSFFRLGRNMEYAHRGQANTVGIKSREQLKIT